MVDGVPITSGNVFFVPVGGGSSAFASLGPGGKFEVKTSANQTGIAVGDYKVYFFVEPAELEDGTVDASIVQLMPEQYTDPGNPLLTATITDSGPNVFDFDLKSEDEGSKKP
jgi:hypothetical protein